MKNALLFLSMIIWGGSLNGQTTITGTLKEKGFDVIVGASIFLKGSFEGTSTDANGQFELTTHQSGEATLVAQYLGYKTLEKNIILDGTPIHLTLFLKPEANTLQEITITAGAFEAGDEKKAVVLNSIDIATTAGANADISGAFATLPGIQQVGESGQLSVRGGATYETRTFIDGMFVQNPYNSTAGNVAARGRFSPFLFKGTTFSTGAYSAEYGQALSSALLLNTHDVAEETMTSVSLMSLGAGLSHTQAWENTSLATSVDVTELGPTLAVLPANVEFDRPFSGQNGQLIFRHKTSPTGILKAYASLSRNRFGLFVPGFADVRNQQLLSLKNDYLFTQLSFQEVLSEKWSIFAGGGFTQNSDEIQSGFALEEDGHTAQGKIRFNYYWNGHIVLKFGGEFIRSRWQEEYTDAGGEVFPTNLNEAYGAAFVESNFYFTRKWAARLGFRAERSWLLKQGNIAPRFSVAYQLNDHSQFSFATGRFYQTPENTLMRYTTELGFEQAGHFILNYQRIKNRRTFRVEAYSKNYDALVRFDGRQPWLTDNSGGGFARGIDLFYRDQKSIRNGDFWIAYSYLDTERHYRDFPTRATPHFASRHNATLVYKQWISELSSSLGMAYVFGSPRPYFNPNHQDFHRDRTPAYHNLSLNWSYITQLFGQFTVLHLSASNLLGLEQTFGYRYSEIANEQGQFGRVAIQPATTQFFFVGLFVSIGKKDDITIDEL